MSYALIKRFTVLALPAALLVAAFAALQRLPLLPAPQQELTAYAPYLALTGGFGLSLAFNRGRIFFALILVAALYLVQRGALAQGVGEPVPRVLFLSLSVIIPVNLTLFCFMRERGIFSHAGRLRLGFLAVQALAVYWMARFRQDYSPIAELLAHPFSRWPAFARFLLPQSSLFFFLVADLLVALRVFKRRLPIDVALLGSLIALGIALNRVTTPFAPALFVTVAALLLTIGVLQDSHSMAFTDELTGLPSRRALNEQVMGLGRSYVVAMLDVDHFKRFNDTYGHDVGDQVLRMVGSKLAKVKGGGRSFRYGGEEFTIIFPKRSLKEVTPHLEELRETVATYQLWLRGEDRPKEAEQGKAKRSGGAGGSAAKSVSVTISIGVAAASEALRTPTEVINAADKALYRAKQRGRNQVAT
ncbi:GGDEF domain-containing protein [Geomonas silvestris]|uniref:diguanylate cyclase n=1 Tax=Geomonas silvestris TaxID=2740184 RepID=A0A6V8MJL2_9BACT|nr:GGDEF domain-containing protein [Geomonas silvestris]GFO59869.1 GGDEF domain-containing protein [Geomonas silvestris]